MHKSSPLLAAALIFAVVFSLFQSVFAQPSRSIALGVYFWQNDQLAPADGEAIRDLKHRAGRLPAVFLIYQSWMGSYARFPWREAKNAKSFGKTLHICWEPWDGRKNGSWSNQTISAGAYDDYIRAYARDARKFGGPILLRFAHEMNGDWYPWSVAYKSRFRRNNGNSPASYVAMWRHVVEIFREEGALNVQWVWAPNIVFLNGFNTFSDQKRDLQECFPGDEWVDWIGLSVYNDGARRPWRAFSELFDDPYDFLTRLSRKPLMIAELGATEEGAPRGTSKAAWMQQTLSIDIPARYPRVQLVNWFCRDKRSLGESNYRFDSSPAALHAFRAAVNSPLYAGAVSGKFGTARLALRD